MTIKIIQITDLHLNKDKEFISHGVNTFRSAKKIISEISMKEKNVDCMVLTGDLADDGTSKAYENLSELLVEFSFPIYLMCGNHDSAENLKNICITKKFCYKNFISIGEWGFYMFNTKKDNSPNGILSESELIDFDQSISNIKYMMIFLHHHPILIGSESMDRMMVENSDELITRIKNQSKIRGVSWGHIHNEVNFKINNAQLFSTPSTCYQARPKSKKFVIDYDANPGYRVINLGKSGVLETSVKRLNINK
tara:strand:- start:464 stop:1219 length:756 start_codon:yes stop_codon:yes gene_type:complete